MQVTSELYQTLLADPRHRKEHKIVIAGEEYGEDRIISMSTSGGLFERDSVCAGSAVSREIDLVIRKPGSIPKGAKLCPWYRLVLGDQASEWIPRGTFYIDTRETNRVNGALTIHGFDGIMLAEKTWEPDQSLEFPMPMDEAAAVIAALLGTELDKRTKLRSDYFVDYPTDDYTPRDVLRFIAAAHGGNWTMTEKGELRLVRLRDLQPETNLLVTEMGQYITMGGIRILVGPATDAVSTMTGSDKTYVGRKAANVQSSTDLSPISKIIVSIDDENYFEVGDDSGQVLEVTCPYGTQAMANNLLAELSGYTYRPLQAQDALIDPAVELGDGVTVDGLYILLAQMDTTFDGLMPSDIGAPCQREIESELGAYVGQITREINRRIAQTRSSITKTAEEIRLEVAGVDGRVTALAVTIDGVTISGPGGQTLIKGSSIETGSIAANSIRADQVNLTGAVTWGDLASDAQGKVTAAQNAANTAQGTIDSWSYVYGGQTYIDGGMLMTDTVIASKLIGGSVSLLTSAKRTAGTLSITGASSADYAIDLSSGGALRLTASAGTVHITSSGGAYINVASDGIAIGNVNLIPAQSSRTIGTAAHPWSSVYATNGSIQTSDVNKKHDIESLPDKYITMLDLVEPVRYKMNDGTSGRYHAGFISQQVKTAMDKAGVEPEEFGGFVLDKDEEGNDIYMLRYDEFTAILLAKIRQFETRIKSLEVQLK